jgi:ubiquinone/menaquinone biosynthesis C-methylase UbiE
LLQSARVPLNEAEFINAAAARAYDEHARRFMKAVYRQFVRKAARINALGKRVLDIGTGSGLLAIELARARPDWLITGIDVSEEMLKLSRENAAGAGLSDRIDFQQAAAVALPFPDDSFALVTSNASFRLWKDPLKVLKEIARVTAPGGYCLMWDNLRLTALCPLLNLIGRAMGMNSAQRRLWLQATRSSYTLGEARAIIKESTLKDARVTFIPFFFMLAIAWRKR